MYTIILSINKLFHFMFFIIFSLNNLTFKFLNLVSLFSILFEIYYVMTKI